MTQDALLALGSAVSAPMAHREFIRTRLAPYRAAKAGAHSEPVLTLGKFVASSALALEALDTTSNKAAV